MQKKDTFIRNILEDIKVESLDLFDRNFERKAFFTKQWRKRKREGRGSLLNVSGNLRRSIRGKRTNTSIRFDSSLAYAQIHNSGGRVHVTPKMRRYFWAQHYLNKSNPQGEFWRNMAMKKGSTIGIPKRQFIGKHPVLMKRVDAIAKIHIKQLTQSLKPIFNKIK